jgi:molybdate/tungstate transport system ATP-binding protein
MISIEKLSIRQGGFSLSEVTMHIPDGKYGVLMGPSGCGKTTIIEAICGLRKIEAGKILLGDTDVTNLPPGERGIGYVPQDGALFPDIPVWEQLGFSMLLRKKPTSEIKARVEELAAQLGILHLLGRKPEGLSGGETQRVALGRALSIRPSFLCLDEPLSALDEDNLEEIIQLFIQTIKMQNVTTLHITHSHSEAKRLGDVIFTLKDGKVQDRSYQSA